MRTGKHASMLFSVALGLTACSQETEQQETTSLPEATESTEQQETVEQAGTAEQRGRQIDQAVGELQRKAKKAESRFGERLIDAGKAFKEGEQNETEENQ